MNTALRTYIRTADEPREAVVSVKGVPGYENTITGDGSYSTGWGWNRDRWICGFGSSTEKTMRTERDRGRGRRLRVAR